MYIGRFAPSPTGPLHFGSLMAAVASYLEAKTQQGQWLVRIEDVDQTRNVKGMATHILQTLEAFGFEWDGTIVSQSQRTLLYENALQLLQDKQYIYPCTCTRKEIADSNPLLGIDGTIYPKTCLIQPLKPNTAPAWRIKTDPVTLSFNDSIQGRVSQTLSQDIGDFILKRADGLFSYQLAVVVDDAEQNITHIVRGADLLASTPRQIYLQQLLNLPTPHYTHIPIATNCQGEKLSKQTLATAIDAKQAPHLIFSVLTLLNQSPPTTIKNATLNEMWRWAVEHWNLNQVPNRQQINTAG